uniref:Uncharacterized protein n=1 Tax=Anopheles minimus TaxID=112268 RepID=A0A182WPS9_9DIPT
MMLPTTSASDLELDKLKKNPTVRIMSRGMRIKLAAKYCWQRHRFSC